MIGRLAVIAGCAYEIVALSTGRLPTITKLIRTAGRHPAGRVLAWGWCGYVAWHFLGPEKS